MAPHSSTLAWKITWTEEPGRLRSIGSLRVGHDWATSLFSLSWIGEGNGNPLQYSCLENPRDAGAWWAAVYGVAQSRTRLKWLSSSSNSLEKSIVAMTFFMNLLPLRGSGLQTTGSKYGFQGPNQFINTVNWTLQHCRKSLGSRAKTPESSRAHSMLIK